MEGFVVHVAPQARPRRQLLHVAVCLAAATLGLVAVVALAGSAARSQSMAQGVSWEQKASRAVAFRGAVATSKNAVRSGPKPVFKAARFQSLGGIMGGLEHIKISGTRYDDGCDRAATTGCKGQKMWVVKGADYSAPEPDEQVSVAEINAEAGTDTPELDNLDEPSADHTAEVEDILSTDPADVVIAPAPVVEPVAAAPAAAGCDALMHDMAAWLECEMNKYR